MARPRKTAEERRDAVLGVRLTAAELAGVEQAASAHGITPADFLRRRALGYRLPPLEAEYQAMASLAAALMPIGVNLNQLTRAANSGKLLPHSITELALRITTLLDGFYGSRADEGRPQL